MSAFLGVLIVSVIVEDGKLNKIIVVTGFSFANSLNQVDVSKITSSANT